MLTTSIDTAALDALVEHLEPRLIERVSEQLTARANSPWLTVKEAADYLRTSPDAIYKRIKRKQLPSYRPEGSPILLHKDDLDGTGPGGAEVL
jgi:excisionase family DNA binding protein